MSRRFAHSAAGALAGARASTGRRSQNIGKHGEQRAMSTLSGLGLRMVEKIATPVIVSRASGKPVIVSWGEKVSGDTRAILPGGRSVLVETKTRLDHNLRWSDLEDHQPSRLDEHANLGGLSLLVWVHDTGIYVMVWPVLGFGPGKSIEVEQAAGIDVNARRYLVGLTTPARQLAQDPEELELEDVEEARAEIGL